VQVGSRVGEAETTNKKESACKWLSQVYPGQLSQVTLATNLAALVISYLDHSGPEAACTNITVHEGCFAQVNVGVVL
jgi:hypothetical protein